MLYCVIELLLYMYIVHKTLIFSYFFLVCKKVPVTFSFLQLWRLRHNFLLLTLFGTEEKKTLHIKNFFSSKKLFHDLFEKGSRSIFLIRIKEKNIKAKKFDIRLYTYYPNLYFFII